MYEICMISFFIDLVNGIVDLAFLVYGGQPKNSKALQRFVLYALNRLFCKKYNKN